MHVRCISEASHAASQRHLKEGWFANLRDVSCEIYQRRLRWDVLKTSPQRHLWDLSLSLSLSLSQIFPETSLSCIWDSNSLLSNWGIFLATYWSICVTLNILQNYYKKFLRAWFKPKIYLGYLYKRKTSLDQMVHLWFPYYFKDFNFFINIAQYWETFQKD